jgi:hypothetical protein
LAAELRRPLHSLICQSDDTDPFLADRPGRRLTGAQWFASLWGQLDVPHGVHLRRLHYLLVITCRSTERLPATVCVFVWRPVGQNDSCRAARYLGLVPAEAFVDRRAPEPIVYIPRDQAKSPFFIVCGETNLTIDKRDRISPPAQVKPLLDPDLDCDLGEFGPPEGSEGEHREFWRLSRLR